MGVSTWNNSPKYEEIPGKLLFNYSTRELVIAIQSAPSFTPTRQEQIACVQSGSWREPVNPCAEVKYSAGSHSAGNDKMAVRSSSPLL